MRKCVIELTLAEGFGNDEIKVLTAFFEQQVLHVAQPLFLMAV